MENINRPATMLLLVKHQWYSATRALQGRGFSQRRIASYPKYKRLFVAEWSEEYNTEAAATSPSLPNKFLAKTLWYVIPLYP
jgi:hypothetical protein